MNISNENIFFVKDNNFINNKFNKENFSSCENTQRNSSISTQATFENDFLYQGEEIDFHQDFFPRYTSIKFTGAKNSTSPNSLKILKFFTFINSLFGIRQISM